MSRPDAHIDSFEGLKVWQTSRDIAIETFKFTSALPAEEKYRLKDQMIRSSRSIADNIAEGYGRFHYQENIQYCRQARGSAYELINQYITAFDCNYISDSELENKKNLILIGIRLLNGYIRYLNKAKSNQVKESEIPYSAENNTDQ